MTTLGTVTIEEIVVPHGTEDKDPYVTVTVDVGWRKQTLRLELGDTVHLITEEEKIKNIAACPFCGWPGQMSSDIGERFVQCVRCKTQGPPAWDTQEAVDLWNTRRRIKEE